MCRVWVVGCAVCRWLGVSCVSGWVCRVWVLGVPCVGGFECRVWVVESAVCGWLGVPCVGG